MSLLRMNYFYPIVIIMVPGGLNFREGNIFCDVHVASSTGGLIWYEIRGLLKNILNMERWGRENGQGWQFITKGRRMGPTGRIWLIISYARKHSWFLRWCYKIFFHNKNANPNISHIFEWLYLYFYLKRLIKTWTFIFHFKN